MSFTPNFDPLLIILITMVIVFIIFFIILAKSDNYWDLGNLLFAMCMSIGFTFCIYGLHAFTLADNYPKLISINNETQKEYIQILPNEHVTTGQYTFCVNGKLQKAEITDNTRYIQDSKDKPYIIVDKVTYNAPYVWYVEQDEIQKKNKEVDYKLKEVHY